MLHIIVNPAASTGHGTRIWAEVKNYLEKEHIEYDVKFTTRGGSARIYAREITSGTEHIQLIILRGDGTVNEVIDGIRDFSLVTLGYIPAGSSNDLARDMRLEHDPQKAVAAILHPKEYAYMDIGKITYENTEKRFVVSTGIGYDAAICREALFSPLKKVLNRFGLGKLTYVGIALKQLAKMKKCGCTVILDDSKKIYLERLMFVTTMIHKYEGGGIMICPDADYKDQLLNVCVVGNLSRLRVLRILPTAYSGKHTRFKGINTYTAKKVTVISDTKMAVHADGESCGMQTKISMQLEPAQLRLIVR